MQILKNGNLKPRLFVCNHCGYEFVADISEYQVSASGDNFFVCCPDCNIDFSQHAPLPLYKEEQV